MSDNEALVKKDSSKTVSGVDLIKNSKTLFKIILYNFRVVHNLCKESGLFSKESLLELDTVAITFREMGRDTATVARMVANQWLDSTIFFYKKINDFGVDELKSTLALLGEQAK